ncbi:hypothetical protein [Pseudoclavibacter sp. JSM 162008]|uniref:hypothetical protein n=1 Tax=Pseudoclavibacter sp. JSM 162008 TaxID=3229855 RepID=UPI0035244B34
MSLLALLAQNMIEAPVPLPAVSEVARPSTWLDVPPYTQHFVRIGTYDGSGSTLHPDVLDTTKLFGAPYRGYRYWMTHTPFPYQDGSKENPSIVVSNNLYDWHDTAVGITNPVIPPPGDPQYNSDNDIAWNPDTNRFEITWRTVQFPNESMRFAYSTDGTTWSAFQTITVAGAGLIPYPGTRLEMLSPFMARFGEFDWRVWHIKRGGTGQPNGGGLVWRDASSPAGPWRTGTDCVLLNIDGSTFTNPQFWHGNATVLPDGRMIGGWSTGDSGGNLTVGSSLDKGKTWTITRQSIMGSYRPAFVLDDDGVHVWIVDNVKMDPARPGTNWLGLSRVPLSVFFSAA